MLTPNPLSGYDFGFPFGKLKNMDYSRLLKFAKEKVNSGKLPIL